MLRSVLILLLSVNTAFSQTTTFKGDYSKLDTLPYSGVPNIPYFNINYIPAQQLTHALEVQDYLRNGVFVPLSSQYLLTAAGQLSTTDDIHSVHGFSNALFESWMARVVGTCPASMCPPLTYRLTKEMKSAALQRICYSYRELSQVPDYPAAMRFLSENHGAVVLLTTFGYESWSVVGKKPDGRAIWLDHMTKKTGPPKVVYKTEAEGSQKWNSMIYGQSYQGQPIDPVNFMVILTMN